MSELARPPLCSEPWSAEHNDEVYVNDSISFWSMFSVLLLVLSFFAFVFKAPLTFSSWLSDFHPTMALEIGEVPRSSVDAGSCEAC